MKKAILILLVLFSGLPYRSLAKAGMADDEFEFVLGITVFLFLVAGIFEGTDYLIKNRKGLFKRVRTFLRNKMLNLRNSH